MRLYFERERLGVKYVSLDLPFWGKHYPYMMRHHVHSLVYAAWHPFLYEHG